MSKPADRSSENAESLQRRFKGGDGSATREVRARVRRILAYRGFGIGKEDRLDLEQTILLQLWQAVSEPGFRGEGFLGLVEIVASRRCIDWFRARRPETALDLVPPIGVRDPDPQRMVLRREQIEHVRAAVEQLPQACLELIRLHVSEGKPYAEIAAIVGRSEGALRVQMHRCIRKAHSLLPAKR